MERAAKIWERTLEVTGQAVGHVLVEVLDAFGQFIRFQLLMGREVEVLVWVHDMKPAIG